MWPLIYNRMSIGEAFVEATAGGISETEKKKYNLFGDPSIILKTDPVANIGKNLTEIPKKIILHQNYPNRR